MYYIWSIEHDAWWMPGSHGYTKVSANAGKYTESEAIKLVTQANIVSVSVPNEALVPVEE